MFLLFTHSNALYKIIDIRRWNESEILYYSTIKKIKRRF
jgi:hypothetical protein